MAATESEHDDGTPPEDLTLAGYQSVHSRPPAYDGPDGHPYTVSIEIERTGDLTAPYSGYLVFPRWAQSGVGIVGHVETSTLERGPSEQSVREALGALTLLAVQGLLAEAIARGEDDG